MEGWNRFYNNRIVLNIESLNVKLKKQFPFVYIREIPTFSNGNHTYKRVRVSFYGKVTKEIKIGRSFFCITAEGKCEIGSYYDPDLLLAQVLLDLYDSIKPYGFNKSFIFEGKDIDEIIEFFGERFKKFSFLKALKKAKLPQWCKDRCSSIEDIEHWEKVREKFLLKKREEAFQRHYNRSKRTIYLGGKIVPIRQQEGCLYSCIESELEKINKLRPVSVWTDGFWLKVNTETGNKSITHSWVIEIMDEIRVRM